MPFSDSPYLRIVDIAGIAEKLLLFKIILLLFATY